MKVLKISHLFTDRNISITLIVLGMLTTSKSGAIVYNTITALKFGLAWVDMIYALLVIVVLDASVLYLTTKGHQGLAAIAGGAIAVLSFMAFIPQGQTLDQQTWQWWVGTLIFSTIFPFLQWYFAGIFDEARHEESEIERLRRELGALSGQAKKLEADIAIAQKDAADYKALAETRRLEAQRSTESLNGMVSKNRLIEALNENSDLLRELETLRPLLPYKSVHDELQVSGRIVMGRNKNLIPRMWSTESGVSFPFDVVHNGGIKE